MKSRNTIMITMLLLGSSLILGGCGGSSSSSTPPGSTSVNVAGTVSAPGGTVASNTPSIIEKFFAMFIGAPAYAAISGVLDVGAGVTVNLIEVDAAGVQVGAVIATATTTAGGAYSLDAPAGFTPGPQYVIRADGGGGATIEARVTSTSVDVDPVSDATSDVVTTTAAGDLSTLNNDEVDAIEDAVDSVSQDIDATGLGVDALATSLETEATNNEASSNVINSTVTAGSICGTVTDSTAAGIANIRVVARDFGNWVTRAKTKTAANGSYCLNVPVTDDTDPYSGSTLTGEYILGAINRTGDGNDSGRHASEWWSTGGTAYNQFDAEMTLVANTTTVTRDFQLELGARITGTVITSDTSANLEGVKVTIRDFDSRTPLTSARVKADGTYRVNVIQGKYLVVARNKTVQPYASEVYDASTGTNNRNFGIPVNVTTGSSTTLDFALEPGFKLSGTITDGTPVTGMRVMVNNNSPGGPADRLRTNKLGNYRIWLKPASYKVYAYGQRNLSVDLSVSNQIVDFSGTVNAITATLVDSNGPVSQAKFRLYDTANTFLGFEISNSDGTVTMHTDQIANIDHRVQIRLDSVSTAGSSIYNGQTQLATATPVTVNVSDVALGPITLPDGGVLTGIVYAGNSGDSTTPIGNFSVEVRDGGTANTNRFTRITTRGDGSYVLTLPPGTYERVRMRDADSGAGANCDTPLVSGVPTSIDVTAGSTTTLNFYDGDNTCELIP